MLRPFGETGRVGSGKTGLCAIVCLSLAVVSFAVAVHAAADPLPCLICQTPGNLNGWTPQVNSVTLSIDNSDTSVPFPALAVSIQNDTRAVGVAFHFPSPVNLTDNMMMTFWVKIGQRGLIRSLYISVGDTSGNWRQYGDSGQIFALEPGNWTHVALDLSTFTSEPSGFDASSIGQIWFGSYDGGSSYNQKFELDNISFSGSSVEPVFNSPTTILPQWLSVIAIFLTYLIAFPLGTVVLQILVRRNHGFNIAVLAPVQIALGLSVETLIFLFALLTTMNVLVVSAMFAGSLLILALLRGRLQTNIAGEPLENQLSTVSAKRRTPLSWLVGLAMSIGVPVFLMSRVSSQLGWAPPNDSLIHSMMVSLVVSNNHLGPTFLPISSLPLSFWSYPRGFLGLSAALSFITGIYPGQSVMLVGASIVALIPALFFSTVLARTKSPLWAAMSFVMTFILPGFMLSDQWVPSHDLLMGAFLVSTYPSLTGNLVLLTLFCTIVLFDDFRPISKGSFKKWLALFLLLTACLAVTYYFYVVFSLLYLSLRFVLSSESKALASTRAWRIKIVAGLLALPVLAYISILARNFAISNLSLNPAVEFELAQIYNPLLYSEYLPYLVIAIVTVILAALLRLRVGRVTNTIAMELFFAVLLVVHIVALSNASVYSWTLWMTDPSRSIIVVSAAGYLMIPLYLSMIKSTAPKIRIFESINAVLSKRSKMIPPLLALFLLTLSISPFVFAIYEYSPSSGRNDILQVPHDGDYLASQWLATHANSSQLILNDLTVSGLSLTSFRALSVVNDMQRLEEGYIFDTLPANQWAPMLGADTILQHPGEYSMVRAALVKYNITYILITTASRTVGLFGSGVRFAPSIDWTMTQSELIATYDANPYLKLVFTAGDSVVYQSVV